MNNLIKIIVALSLIVMVGCGGKYYSSPPVDEPQGAGLFSDDATGVVIYDSEKKKKGEDN